MTDGTPLEPSAPADAHLIELMERVRSGNGDLYRHLALYLQVLRQILPMRVERAVFHLATQVQPRRYAQLPADDRLQLHRRLRTLVDRCSSLLTVEQLVTLAAQMSRERERQERRERQRLLQHFATASAGSGQSQPWPMGSVNLDGPPPLSAGLLQSLSTSLAPNPLEEEPVEGDAIEPMETPLGDPGAADDSVAQAFAEGWPLGIPLPGMVQRLIGESPSRASRPWDPWGEGRLPSDPVLLLRWLEGVDDALSRRLRNLSHAINVELLRAGLSASLLPVSLLDGVLAGQIDTQPAPPNLLRLRLPFPAEDASPLLVMAVLLRRVDLELEEPRLRTCRRRLHQHRQEVRRMAQQFRRLQRRREAHEAEQLWLQDRRANLSPPG